LRQFQNKFFFKYTHTDKYFYSCGIVLYFSYLVKMIQNRKSSIEMFSVFIKIKDSTIELQLGASYWSSIEMFSVFIKIKDSTIELQFGTIYW